MSAEQQDRGALADVLQEAFTASDHGITWDDAAEAILASGWLAERVRAAKAEAWDSGYDRACADIDWSRPRGTRKISPNPYRANHA